MNENNNKKTIFISYSHKDVEAANRLLADLKEVDDADNPQLELFLDKESLLAGQDWKYVIDKAIKNTQYFVILLSKNSIESNTYVQEELKVAKEIATEHKESKIFIIPIRLDECQILEPIQNLHTVDLFPNWKEGFERILKAMAIETKPRRLSQQNWENLLNAIDQDNCIPFIGQSTLEFFNQVDDQAFTTYPELAKEWADKYDYPIGGAYELPKIAQYLAINEGREKFPKETMCNKFKQMKAPDFSSDRFNKSPHAILAQLNLSIYTTTNYDHFMEEALKNQGKQPETEICRWNQELINDIQSEDIPSKFGKKSKYKPTPNNPIVFHFHGSINYPQSLVLTERDYFDFVINTNKFELEKDTIPSFLRKELKNSSLLFIGYSLNDDNFRSIFQGALTFMATVSRNRTSIAVIQIPSSESDNIKKEKVKKYMEKYTANMFEIIVYWGDSHEFIEDLRNKWREFKNKSTTSGP
jgi:hypothetical protein